jgi:hypothetical protein
MPIPPSRFAFPIRRRVPVEREPAWRGRESPRRPLLGVAAALAVLAAAGPTLAQAISLPPFAFSPPPGFARAAGDGVVLRDGDANELTAVAYAGVNPLAGLPLDEVTEALAQSVAGALSPAGFAWIEPPVTTRRADGVLVFRALAARREERGGAAIQCVLYAIAPQATLHVSYAGIGQIAAARAALAAIVDTLRVAGR